MVKLKVRGDRLYAEYTRDGKRVRKSLSMENTRQNVAYVHRHIIPNIERKIKYSLQDVYKLSEFADVVMRYTKETKKRNTVVNYKIAFKKFFKIMGDVNIEDVRIIDIDRYIRKLQKDGMSSATITVYLAPIALAFKEAIRADIIDKNPVQYARKPIVKNKEKEPFTLLQMHTLLRNAEDDLKTFLYIAFYTGARAGEIIALRWSDISNNKITISKTKITDGTINSPKNGKSRTIQVLSPLGAYLDSLEKKSDFIFSIGYQMVALKFKKLLKKLGYKKATLHTTRHTFTSLLIQARESPTLIQHFLGHSNLDMINKVYAHYIEDDRDIDRIEKVLNL